MAKLSYTVLTYSSADPEFPAAELNVHSPHTRGWQTPRFCECDDSWLGPQQLTRTDRYPQQVIIQLSRYAMISQIQLLSHQHKIVSHILSRVHVERF